MRCAAGASLTKQWPLRLKRASAILILAQPPRPNVEQARPRGAAVACAMHVVVWGISKRLRHLRLIVVAPSRQRAGRRPIEAGCNPVVGGASAAAAQGARGVAGLALAARRRPPQQTSVRSTYVPCACEGRPTQLEERGSKIDRLIITLRQTSVRENTTTPGAGMGAPRRLAALSAQLCPGSSTTCCPVSAAPRPLYIDEVPFQLSEEQKYEFVSRATAPPAASVDPWMPCDAPL